MGLAIIHSRASIGVQAPAVTVEVHISNGMPGFNLVGLPETTVKESRDRVRSAIINSRFEFPAKRITVNLAPADLPKEGGRFDLPIALGILAASEQLPLLHLERYEFIGELALSGEIRRVKGVLPAALAAHKAKRSLVVPQDNGDQAALVSEGQHKSAQTLLEVCADLCGQKTLTLFQSDKQHQPLNHQRDLQDIIGQQQGKRALEIAAAGSHNLLFLGPPGTGKTMLASRLCDLLPEMSDEEAMETASVASLTEQYINQHNWKLRPFRSPHHSSSMAALVGGGTIPRPGEISLAHNGLLFLDEMPEFERKVLDSLRERMIARSGKVNALLQSREIETYCRLHKADAEFLESALHRLGLSIRAYHRIIKVARTIADLQGEVDIQRTHLAEALGYRSMDRLLKQLSAQAVL